MHGHYPGAGPAFVLMHGFPDHLGIYDDLVPLLVAGGRRVVTFDFLGFGRSDRPAGASYTFEGQVEDLSAGGVAFEAGKVRSRRARFVLFRGDQLCACTS